jgi:pimeloyl-ACP methyl ester carboxylesterase
VKALTSLGYRVILAEYPCYGAREGIFGERPFVRDALETLGLAYQHYGGPFFLIGESLGCGVAAAAAKETPVKIEGIILITPWDTLLSVAKAKFPWFPLGLLMKDKYNTIENLKGYHGRIAVIAAERDNVIPMTHAASLYQSLTGCKAMWVIDGAGHNDWPMHVNDTWWHEIIGFVDGPLRL